MPNNKFTFLNFAPWPKHMQTCWYIWCYNSLQVLLLRESQAGPPPPPHPGGQDVEIQLGWPGTQASWAEEHKKKEWKERGGRRTRNRGGRKGGRGVSLCSLLQCSSSVPSLQSSSPSQRNADGTHWPFLHSSRPWLLQAAHTHTQMVRLSHVWDIFRQWLQF